MDKKNLVIIGAGGLGKEVLWLIKENNKKTKEWNVLGFVDNNQEIYDKIISGYKIIGDDHWLINYDKPLNVVFGIGSVKLREKIYNKVKHNNNLIFPNIIANDAVMSNMIEMGVGCVICSNTILTVDVILGSFVTINYGCTIGHDTTITDFTTIYPGVNVSGNVTINSGAEMGTGSCIIQGLSIGENTIIGAGAVVIRDIPENSVAVGNPAKVIKQIDNKTGK